MCESIYPPRTASLPTGLRRPHLHELTEPDDFLRVRGTRRVAKLFQGHRGSSGCEVLLAACPAGAGPGEATGATETWWWRSHLEVETDPPLPPAVSLQGPPLTTLTSRQPAKDRNGLLGSQSRQLRVSLALRGNTFATGTE